MSTHTALLVIDVQVGLIDNPAAPAYQSTQVLQNISSLLAQARATATPIIYVQHTGDEGSILEPDTPGWQIHPAIAPQNGEPIIQKRAADSFYGTPLKEKLDALQISHLVITGCKTQNCIDTTCRQATSLNYDVTLVSDAHTTTDTSVLSAAQIVAHHNETLDDFGNDEHAIVLKAAADVQF